MPAVPAAQASGTFAFPGLAHPNGFATMRAVSNEK